MALAHEASSVAPGAATLQASPVSIRHAALHPSPAVVPPSSQPSPASRTPLPQVSAGSHTPAPPLVVSHRPLAHEASPVTPGDATLQAVPVSIRQAALQPSPFAVPPSSQASPTSSMPLPHAPIGSHTPTPPPVVSHRPLAHDALPVTPGLAPLHASPSSIRHVALQPSPPAVPPSSQPSPASRTPLPHVLTGSHTPGAPAVASHTVLAHESLPVLPGVLVLHGRASSIRHAALQPSPGAVPPSSQPSPASRTPLPHTLFASQKPGRPPVLSHRPLWHDALAVAPGATTLQAMPSSTRHAALQPSPGVVPPSSQPSPVSSTPLPQLSPGSHTPSPPPVVSQMPLWHDASPVAPGVVPLQASPSSIRQVALQPSPFATPPSSQPSPASRRPLPQVFAGSHTPVPPPVVSHTPVTQDASPVAPGAVALHPPPVSTRHAALQPSPPVVPPSSQPSPASRSPLPQVLAGSHTPTPPPVVSHTPLAQDGLPRGAGSPPLQVRVSSIKQLPLQPSPGAVPPSSQPSPTSRTPLPQVLAGSHTPAPPPVVSQMALWHDAPPVAPGAEPLQASPFSIKHDALHPSPEEVPPSSQPSPASRTPLPHVLAGSHTPGAPLVASHTPLAHESFPVAPGPLPLHGRVFSIRQAALQPSPDVVPPSSQPSPASRAPLPHTLFALQIPGAPPVTSHRPLWHEALPVAPGIATLQASRFSTRQLALQPSPDTVAPSSQPSPASRTPLPHVLIGSHTPVPPPVVSHRPLWHDALPVAPGAVPLQASVVSIRQLALQPSPAVVPPSSQPSPASRTPLPHVLAGSHTPGAPPVVSHTALAHEPLPVAPGVATLQARVFSIRQAAVQPSPAVVPPSSQPSPASRTPLPHVSSASQVPVPPPVVSHRPLRHDVLPVSPGARPLHALPFSIRQVALQPSPFAVPPSSQPSPASRTPLPQVASGSHTPGAPLVVSHRVLAHDAPPVRPGAVARQLVPFSIVHRALQPSPAVVLPSSQPSAASTMPLPHVSDIGMLWHCDSELAPLTAQPPRSPDRFWPLLELPARIWTGLVRSRGVGGGALGSAKIESGTPKLMK